MSDETTLLPCPFCGGEAHIEKYCDRCSTEIKFKCSHDKSPNAMCTIGEEVFWVEHECKLLSNDEELYVGCFASASEAIAAWNTRADMTCEPKWILQGKTQTQEFWRCECGNCGECFGVEDRSSFPFKMTIDKVEIPNFCQKCGCKVVDE